MVRERRVWRYQRGNQNPYIEEGQTTQWPKEERTKGQTTIYKSTHTTTENMYEKLFCKFLKFISNY